MAAQPAYRSAVHWRKQIPREGGNGKFQANDDVIIFTFRLEYHLQVFQLGRNGEIVRDAAGNELGYVAGLLALNLTQNTEVEFCTSFDTNPCSPRIANTMLAVRLSSLLYEVLFFSKIVTVYFFEFISLLCCTANIVVNH